MTSIPAETLSPTTLEFTLEDDGSVTVVAGGADYLIAASDVQTLVSTLVPSATAETDPNDSNAPTVTTGDDGIPVLSGGADPADPTSEPVTPDPTTGVDSTDTDTDGSSDSSTPVFDTVSTTSSTDEVPDPNAGTALPTEPTVDTEPAAVDPSAADPSTL